MGAVELGLSGHDRSHRCASRHSVNRAGKVKLGLHAPQFLVLIGREELRWIARRDPADWHDCPRVQLGVDVEHAVDSQFHSAAGDRSGKQRCAGRNETSSSTVAPLMWACGPMSTALPTEVGFRERPRTSAFSMITTSSPIETSPSSAVTTAPCSTRVRSPNVTAPHSTADGATYAEAGITGRSPRCIRIMTGERSRWEATRCRRTENGS